MSKGAGACADVPGVGDCRPSTLKKGGNMPAPIVSDSVASGIRKFLEALNSSGGTPIEQLSPKDARQVLVGAQNSVQVDLSGIDRLGQDDRPRGRHVVYDIVRPAGRDRLPVFMFFHGGGWVLGDFPTHERLVRDLVVDSGAAAVFLNYTPSPEASYPVAIDQAYAATSGCRSSAARSTSTAAGWPWSATASAATWRRSSR